MTVSDLANNFRLQGLVTIKKWNEDKNDFDVLYESDIENDYPEEEICEMEITYMYPVTLKTSYGNDYYSTIVIEVE